MEFLEGEANPLAIFAEWYGEAQGIGLAEPTAMTLATTNSTGRPSARIVLLKSFSEAGFTFYTNTASRKGKELAENPHAALLFYWMPLKRQIRIEGHVEPATKEEADEYYNSRPYGSRIGAWASKQSSPLRERTELTNRIAEFEAKFPSSSLRPPHWSGYRLVPNYIEFWEEAPYRLHNRRAYTRTHSSWQSNLLYP